MDHISSGNEACESKNTQGVTNVRFSKWPEDVPNRSTVHEFTFPPTSSCHRDFFQHVAVEREPKGKNHPLEIKSKKSKVDLTQTGKID